MADIASLTGLLQVGQKHWEKLWWARARSKNLPAWLATVSISALLWLAIPINAIADELCSLSAIETSQKTRVSVAFAGENIRSPASIFGHTFLVFHDKDPPEPDSVIFEFIGETANQSLPVVSALTGGLPGRFRKDCFYRKQWDYDQEDRDIWLYRLRLTAKERASLDTISEKHEPEKYGFIHNNCAFRIYEILLRSMDVRPPFSLVHVPINGIKDLNIRGRIEGEAFFLPSSWTRFSHTYDSLSFAQRDAFIVGLNTAGSNIKDPSVATALSRFVNFRIRKEPKPGIRNTLFLVKKTVQENSAREPLTSQNPIKEHGMGIFRLDLSPTSGQSQISIIPGVRTPWTKAVAGGRSNRLEYGRLVIGGLGAKMQLFALRIFEMDGLIPSGDFTPGFGRVFEIGYEDISGGLRKTSKYFDVRFGYGYAGSAAKTVDFAIMPVFDAGLYHSESSFKPDVDLGIRVRALAWLSHRVHLSTTWEALYLSARGYQYRLDKHLNVAFSDNWGFGAGLRSFYKKSESYYLSTSLRF